MITNMGTIDRIIRLVVVAVIGVLYFTGQISGAIATVLAVMAIIFLITSLLGFCPVYLPLKLSTKKQNKS